MQIKGITQACQYNCETARFVIAKVAKIMRLRCFYNFSIDDFDYGFGKICLYFKNTAPLAHRQCLCAHLFIVVTTDRERWLP